MSEIEELKKKLGKKLTDDIRQEFDNVERKLFALGLVSIKNDKERSELERKNKALSKLNLDLGKEGLEREELVHKLRMKVDELMLKNVTLTNRLNELTESDSIVIEDGDVKGIPLDRFLGVGLHSPDIYSSGPIGAPIGLATEIAKMLNKESVEKILKEAGGQARVSKIATALNSSAKAVYRFISKTAGMHVGDVEKPDYKEENTNAWLDGQERPTEEDMGDKAIKSETEGTADADEQSDGVESSEEGGVPTEVLGDEDRPKDDEGGSG